MYVGTAGTLEPYRLLNFSIKGAKVVLTGPGLNQLRVKPIAADSYMPLMRQ